MLQFIVWQERHFIETLFLQLDLFSQGVGEIQPNNTVEMQREKQQKAHQRTEKTETMRVLKRIWLGKGPLDIA